VDHPGDADADRRGIVVEPSDQLGDDVHDGVRSVGRRVRLRPVDDLVIVADDPHLDVGAANVHARYPHRHPPLSLAFDRRSCATIA